MKWPDCPSPLGIHHHGCGLLAGFIRKMLLSSSVHIRDGPGAGPGRWECFEGRAGRPVPAMTLSDVPHKPRSRAFAPPGHGLAIFPRSLSLACLAVLRPRVPLPRYFVAAAHQSTPGPWCRGGVGLLGASCVDVSFRPHVLLVRFFGVRKQSQIDVLFSIPDHGPPLLGLLVPTHSQKRLWTRHWE